MANSLPGIEVSCVRNINAEILAPGASPGRMTIFTEGAIELLEKEKLFTGEMKKPERAEAKKPEEKTKEKAAGKKKEAKVAKTKKPAREPKK